MSTKARILGQPRRQRSLQTVHRGVSFPQHGNCQVLAKTELWCRADTSVGRVRTKSLLGRVAVSGPSFCDTGRPHGGEDNQPTRQGLRTEEWHALTVVGKDTFLVSDMPGAVTSLFEQVLCSRREVSVYSEARPFLRLPAKMQTCPL